MERLNYKYFYPNLDDNVKNNSKKQKYYYNRIPHKKFESINIKDYETIYVFVITNISYIFNFYKNNSLKMNKKVKNSKILNVSMIGENCFMFNDVSFLNNTKNLYVIDDLILNILSNTYLNKKELKKDIIHFVKYSKFIYISAELFYTDKLFYTGLATDNFEFIKMFLLKSKQNYVLNTQNIILMHQHGISSNYYPSYQFENIELTQNEKTIDVLFYGNNPKVGFLYFFNHRNNIINNLKIYSEENNIKFENYDNLYDKDEILSKTKIVLQIPNYKNFHSYPWAKTLELINKKVFFIIEENEEMYIQKLDKYVIYYKRNDLNNLYELINYYLKNEKERIKVINKCFDYVKNKYDYNVFI